MEASAHLLSEKETKKFIDTANDLLDAERRNHWDILFTKHIFTYERPNEFTGYCVPDLNKIAQIIKYFTPKTDVLKTKLNKLLFYTDFTYYKQSGYSMTGISYRAIPHGPVPSAYDKMYTKLCDDKLISLKHIPFADGNYGEAIMGTNAFDDSLFSDLEKKILEGITKKFLKLKTKEIVDLSHQEEAWISNEENKQIISYQKFAFDLKNM